MHSNETAIASYSTGIFSQQNPGPIFKTYKGDSCYIVVIPWVSSALVFSFLTSGLYPAASQSAWNILLEVTKSQLKMKISFWNHNQHCVRSLLEASCHSSCICRAVEPWNAHTHVLCWIQTWAVSSCIAYDYIKMHNVFQWYSWRV